MNQATVYTLPEIELASVAEAIQDEMLYRSSRVKIVKPLFQTEPVAEKTWLATTPIVRYPFSPSISARVWNLSAKGRP